MSDVIQAIFQNKTADPSKLLLFGFEQRDSRYVYRRTLSDSGFVLTVSITAAGEIATEVIDPAFHEPYTLHLADGAAQAVVTVEPADLAGQLTYKTGDAAIATEGAKLAQEIVENELVMETDAYKNGHIVYLAHPTVWYTAEGGITALDIMLQDLESALGVSAAAAE